MPQQSKEINYFASMTDMMVGVLFIFIIMVAYFAFQITNEKTVPFSLYEGIQQEKIELQKQVQTLRARLNELESELARLKRENATLESENTALKAQIAKLKKEIAQLRAQIAELTKPNPVEQYIQQGGEARNDIVEDVVRELKASNIDAEAVFQQGVVTISGKGLFGNGRSDLQSVDGASNRVNVLSDVLSERLECFVFGAFDDLNNYKDCNPSLLFLEAVFIEGHTDNQPIPRGVVLVDGSKNNLELSAKRATNTYQQIVERNNYLTSYTNPADQQVLSVAAYGEQRPISNNATALGRQNNRRIDIRFVMYVPKDQQALADFKARFE